MAVLRPHRWPPHAASIFFLACWLLAGQIAHATTAPAAQFLLPNGRLNTAAIGNQQLSLDLKGWDVHLDPKLGPVFSPAPVVTTGFSSLDFGLGGTVKAIAVSGNDVYVGGGFTTIGTGGTAITGLNRIAKWNGTDWSALGAGLDNFVNVITISGSDIYVGGEFDNVGGGTAVSGLRKIARWNIATSTWSSLGPGLNNSVHAIAVNGSDVYVGGAFTQTMDFDVSNLNYIARWNGSAWSAMGSGFESSVYAIAVLSGTVYAGGSFTNNYLGTNNNLKRIAQWNGSAWVAVGAGLNNDVNVIVASGTNLYVGGSFTNVGTGSVSGLNYIARWSGTAWSAMGSGLNDRVYAISVVGTDVYAGGEFTGVGGGTPVSGLNKIAKWTGTAWSALDQGLFSTVNTIAAGSTYVYAGGAFRIVGTGGTPVTGLNRIAKWGEVVVTPMITVAGTLTAFSACANTASSEKSFTVSGSNLTADIIVTAPTGFEVSNTSGSGFGATATLAQNSGSVSATVYVRMAAGTASPSNGNVTCASTGATTRNVAVSGTVNALTINVGSIGNAFTTATSFSIPYTATGAPNQYSLVAGTPTDMPNFTDIPYTNLPANSISVTIPASAVNTYNFNLRMRNTTTGCESAVVPVSLTVTTPPPSLNPTLLIKATSATGTNNYSGGNSTAVDASGNTYVAGSFGGSVSFGTTTLTSAGGEDIFLAKYDNTGAFLWAKRAGGTGYDYATGVAVSGNDVYITGAFRNTVNFNNPSASSSSDITSAGGADIFLAKYNSTGAFQWAKRAGGTGLGTAIDVATGVAVLGTEVYITGTFYGTANFNNPSASGSREITAAGVSGPLGSPDIFLAKYDNTGDFKWAKRAGGTGFDEAYSVAVSGTEVYITGDFVGTANFNTPTATGSKEITAANNSFYDIFLAKYDNTGDWKWAKRAGGTGNDIAKGVAVSGTEVYITGKFSGTTNFNNPSATSSSDIISAGGDDIFLAKYDNLGAFQWAKRAGAGSTINDEASSVAVSGTEVYITGKFSGTANFNTPSASSNGDITSASSSNDIFLAKYDDTGDFKWAKRGGGNDNDEGKGVAISGTEVYITGNFRGAANFNTPSAPGSNELTTSATSGEFFLVRYGSTAPATTLTIGMAINPTNCTPSNGSISFTSTGIAEGEQTLNYSKDGVGTSATVNVAADGSFTLSGLGAGTYTAFAIGATAATGTNPTLVPPALPAINLGTSPVVCLGAANADLPFTITGSADIYAIDYDGTAETSGFTDVDISTSELLPTSNPIALNIPSGVQEGIYHGAIRVRNNTTNCYSAPVPFTITISQVTADNTTADAAICEGTTKSLTGTPAGGTWSIVGMSTGSISGATYSTGDVAANENVTIRYTIAANGACPATTEDVTFMVNANPGAADNTTSNGAICEGTDKALTGTPAGGTWSIVGMSTGSISGTTYNTGNVAANENVTIRYTIAANGACAATTEDVTFTVNANPGTADNTTSNAAICEGTTKSLTGTPAGGAWSIVGMAMGTISGSTYSTGNVAANENVTIRYTIAASGACPATTEDVTFTVNANPGVADNTTSNTAICEGADKALTGTPAGGTWSIVGMATGSISGSTYSTGNVAANENVTIRYTIAANGACAATTEDVTFAVNANPGAADNTTSNAAICEGANKPLTGTPTGGTWSIVGMATGTISGSTYSTGNVAANENVTIRYTIAASGTCAATTEDVTFTVNANPGTADNTTSNAAICEGTNKALTGMPAGGTWSIVGMATGFISGSTYSTGNVAANENVTIRYTIAASGACVATTEDVTFAVNANPSAADNTTSNAAICEGADKQLTGIPAGGTWSIVGMATGTISGSTYSTGNVSANENVTIRYTIAASGACDATTEDVTFAVNANPTANAGLDQTNATTCGLTTVTLTAGNPTVGTGAWSIVNGMGGVVATPSSPTSTFSGTAGSTYTLRWTVSNAPCAAATDDMDVTFNQAPSFSACPPGVTVNATSGCAVAATYTATAAGTTPAGTVNYSFGGNTTGSGSGTGSGSAFNLGTTLVTLTAANTCGTNTCSFNVVVQAGEINVRGNGMDITKGSNPPSVADHTDFGQTISGNIVRTFTVQNTTGTAPLNVTSIALTGTNANQFGVGALSPASPIPTGQSATFTVTYAPNATGVHNATVVITNGDCNEGTYDFAIRGELTCSPPVVTAPASSNGPICPGATLNLSVGASGTAPLAYAWAGTGAIANGNTATPTVTGAATGTYTVTITNGCGSATNTVAVTVADTQRPSITCPSNIARGSDANTCGAVVTYAAATATDNCSTPTVAQTSGPLASGSTFPVGVSSVTFTATDAAANTTACTFTVTVTDTQTPGITCPGNLNRNTDPGTCSALVSYANPTTSDNCALPTGHLTWVSGGTGHVSGSPNSSATFQKGLTTVQWMVTDGAGLTKTCTFRITVTDIEPPAITCPPPINANAGTGTCTATVTYTAPPFTDNCAPTSGTSVRISGLPSGSAFPVGTSTVVFRATDAAGKTKTCSMQVMVTDTELPNITCPSSTTVTGSGTPCQATVFYASATASDNCDGTLSPFLLSGLGSGSNFPAGVTTNTWRASATNGQSSDCSFTVTVNCGTARGTGTAVERTEDANASNALSPSEESVALDFSLSPNPASAEVAIRLVNQSSNLQIHKFTNPKVNILDVQGRLVWSQPVAPEGEQTLRVDVSDWTPGIYMVTLRGEGAVITKRLSVLPSP